MRRPFQGGAVPEKGRAPYDARAFPFLHGNSIYRTIHEMAFGFLKKLVEKITGGSSAAKPAKKGAAQGKDAGAQKRGKRGKRGRGTRGGGAQGRQQQGEGSGDAKPRQARAPQQGRRQQSAAGAADKQQPAAGERHARQPRQERQPRGERGERGRRGRTARESVRGANTPADEMRPGGVVSAEERARRKEAHAAWSLDSFAVDPAEGKKRFHDFDLPGEVMHGIADLGFKYCTEIQALSLEHALAGKNLAGKAQTGSGKTAAFLTAILTRYLRTPENRQKKGGAPRALVLAPTRELVIQICKDADAIGKYCELRQLAVYGGMDYDRQKSELLEEPVDLLVATPGRLIDFCRSHVVDLSHVDTLVIDEADRMLDMGFIPDVSRIMGHLPPRDKRATMLYSATLTDDVMRLASRWMDAPVKAEVESDHNATDTVRQVVYVIRAEDKFKVLFNHIALHPEARAIVFCNRKATTEDVFESLRCRGVKCEMLSGDVSQNKRLTVLEDFRAGKIKIVVATDVAGRGIHVDDIEYVVNFDFPYEAEDYVHRIGRTGRAGHTGIAISFADEDESFQIPEIEKYINEPLKCTMVQDDDPLLAALPPPPPRGRRAAPAPVDAAAREAVAKREAVTAEEMAAAARVTGGSVSGYVQVPDGEAPAESGGADAPADAGAEAPAAAAEPAPSPVASDAPAPEAAPAPAAPAPAQKQANVVYGRTASGREMALPESTPPDREMPAFDSAFETKKTIDESDVYSKPVAQKERFEDWTPQT